MTSRDQAFLQARAAFERGDLQRAALIGAAILDKHGPHLDTLRLMGHVSSRLGRFDAALVMFDKAQRLAPGEVDVVYNRGLCLAELGRLAEAAADFRAAIEREPAFADAHLCLGSVLTRQGAYAEAIACLERAIAARPGYEEAWSAYLVALYYGPDASLAGALEAAREWDRAVARPLDKSAERPAPATDRSAERRLRVGFVSPDLRRHPVGFFTDAFFTHHDRDSLELYCYSDALREDDYSARFASQCAAWRRTGALAHAELAELIRADRIDVLLELAGHTKGNRLCALAMRCAPVQACWAGYFGTTGLSSMDFLVSDPVETPGGSEIFYTEKLARLPHDYVCYTPPDGKDGGLPDVGPLPAPGTGRVTFGCFNNLAKLHDGVAALWARVLDAVPGARLLLKNSSLADAETEERTGALFAAHGVGPDRLVLRGGSPHRELLATYNEIDVALDPFPYSGGLTTCESLVMGVPVLTLPGETYAARHSAAHLAAAGLSDWIVENEEAYVARAARAAGDLDGLAGLRAGLRARVLASPLCDGVAHTRAMESAIRTMWTQYTQGGFTHFSVKE